MSSGAPSDENKSDYWDRYYSGQSGAVRPIPSQFATFVAGELGQPHRIVEFGCGAGRDSLFFRSHGHEVVGVDGSAAAVERCTRTAEAANLDVAFMVASVADPALVQQIPPTSLPTAVYARFFLHAITEDEQATWFETARQLTSPGDLLAVEYRTTRDQQQVKVTGVHYRRFIDPVVFNREAGEQGFQAEYAVEGFGFAKYKKDDAYVARSLLRRV